MINETLLEKLSAIDVLLVEDDIDLQEAIKTPLLRRCHSVYTAQNGNDGVALFKEKKPHLVITDINLPGLSGLEMAQKIRQHSHGTPIIVITAHSNQDNLLSSLDVGVHTLLKKPIDLEELFIAILGSTRQVMITEPITIAPDLIYKSDEKILRKSDITIPLTRKEVLLLELLLLHRGQTVGYEEFRNLVWKGGAMTLDSLRMHINSLRKKVGEEMIKNHSGVGYKLL